MPELKARKYCHDREKTKLQKTGQWHLHATETEPENLDAQVAELRASLNNHDADFVEAAELRDEILKNADEQELAKTELLLLNWQKAPCEWQDVIR